MNEFRRYQVKFQNKIRTIKSYFYNPFYINKILHCIFILTLISVFFPLIIWGSLEVGEIFSGMTHSWVFFLFLPIPLFCLWIGIKYKKAGYKCKKNIVLGIFYSLLFITLGSNSFIYEDFFSKDYAIVLEVEKKIKFDLPNQGKINTEFLMDEKEERTGESRSYVSYSKEEIKRLEERILNSELWIKKLNSFQSMMEPSFVVHYGNHEEYYMFYIEELDCYNEIPEKSGIYTIDYLVYDATAKGLYIYQYAYDFQIEEQ